MPWREYIPAVIAVAGSLIMFGWLKKTISNNEKDINKLKDQKHVTLGQCGETHDKLANVLSKIDEKLDHKTDMLHREIQQNKTVVTSQFLEVVKVLGKLEGILNHGQYRSRST